MLVYPKIGFRVSGLKLAPSAFTTAEDHIDGRVGTAHQIQVELFIVGCVTKPCWFI